MQTIHILDNRDDCNARLQKAVSALGGDLQLRFWPNGNSLIAGCAEWFPNAAVLSLNCEPDPRGETVVTGTALDLARFIGDFPPVCPVVIHSSNAEGARAIIKELRSAHWMAEHIAPLGADWIERRWLSRVRTLLDDFGNTWSAHLPPDHQERLERMRLSLDGLGVGDALGQMLSYRSGDAPRRLAEDELPPSPWRHTDDTEMAISVAAVLKWHGELDQDALAKRFARRFQRDPDRGYGSMTRRQLEEITAGRTWQDTSVNAFGGRGSMGNGGAMRVALLERISQTTLGHALLRPAPRPSSPTCIPKALQGLSPLLLRPPWPGNSGIQPARLSPRGCLMTFWDLHPKARFARAFCGLGLRPLTFYCRMRPELSATARRRPLRIPFPFACGWPRIILIILLRRSAGRSARMAIATQMPRLSGELSR